LAGQGDTFALTAVFPDEPEALEDIPRTLSTRGLLEIRGGGEVLITNDDVEIAAVRLDLTMTPSTLIVVTMDGAKRVARWMNSDPEGRMVYFIDGVEVYESSNHKPFSDAELEIPPNAANDRAQMALAAHWGIVIGHPLPCDLTVTSTRVVDRAPTDE
jgi:hypothetical protein